MIIDFDGMAERVFKTLKGMGYTLATYDEDGNETITPTDMRKFYVKENKMMVTIEENGDRSEIKLYLSKTSLSDLKDIQPLINSLRETSVHHNVTFTVRKYDKDLSPKDFAFMSQNKVDESLNEKVISPIKRKVLDILKNETYFSKNPNEWLVYGEPNKGSIFCAINHETGESGLIDMRTDACHEIDYDEAKMMIPHLAKVGGKIIEKESEDWDQDLFDKSEGPYYVVAHTYLGSDKNNTRKLGGPFSTYEDAKDFERDIKHGKVSVSSTFKSSNKGNKNHSDYENLTKIEILNNKEWHRELPHLDNSPLDEKTKSMPNIAQHKEPSAITKARRLRSPMFRFNTDRQFDWQKPGLRRIAKRMKDRALTGGHFKNTKMAGGDGIGESLEYAFIGLFGKSYVDFVHELESKNITESMWGSNKSSYQRVGEVKLIIRHKKAVSEGGVGARGRNIKSIYLETKDGERYLYPSNHIQGARAAARHISEGGKFTDELSEDIKKVSENVNKLRELKHWLWKKRSSINENAQDLYYYTSGKIFEMTADLIKLGGKRGYRTHRNALNKWYPAFIDNVEESIDSTILDALDLGEDFNLREHLTIVERLRKIDEEEMKNTTINELDDGEVKPNTSSNALSEIESLIMQAGEYSTRDKMDDKQKSLIKSLAEGILHGQINLYPMTNKQKHNWSLVPKDKPVVVFLWRISDIAERAKNDILSAIAGRISSKLENQKNEDKILLPKSQAQFAKRLLSIVPAPIVNSDEIKPDETRDSNDTFREMNEFFEWTNQFKFENIFEAPKKKKEILIDTDKKIKEMESKGQDYDTYQSWKKACKKEAGESKVKWVGNKDHSECHVDGKAIGEWKDSKGCIFTKAKKGKIKESDLWTFGTELINNRNNPNALKSITDNLSGDELVNVLEHIETIYSPEVYNDLGQSILEFINEDDTDLIMTFNDEDNYRNAVMNLLKINGLDFVENDGEHTLTFNDEDSYNQAKTQLDMDGISVDEDLGYDNPANTSPDDKINPNVIPGDDEQDWQKEIAYRAPSDEEAMDMEEAISMAEDMITIRKRAGI